jgi:hypothetical protein
VEKNGYPWRSLVTLENTTKVCRVKPTFHVYPRRALPGTPCVPTRAIFWDIPGYLWGMSEGIFLRMFWDLQNSEMSREFPAILGLSWFGLFCTCWLRFPRWDYLGSLPWGIIWDRLRLSGKPRKRL